MSAPFCCLFWQIVTVLNSILQHTLAAKTLKNNVLPLHLKYFEVYSAVLLSF